MDGVNGESIHGTRPWKIFGESPSVKTAQGETAFNEEKRKDLTAADIRFTRKGNTLFAFVMGWPDYQTIIRPLATETALRVGKIQNVELLGYGGKVDWSQDGSGLKITLPAEKPCEYAVAFKIDGAIRS